MHANPSPRSQLTQNGAAMDNKKCTNNIPYNKSKNKLSSCPPEWPPEGQVCYRRGPKMKNFQ